MGLVDYSDSDAESSGSEAVAATKPARTVLSRLGSKKQKPFQKIVDRSNPGKILVNLPQAADAAATAHDADRPAKRARTTGPTPFCSFNALLPPPKHANAQTVKKPSSSTASPKPRPGIGLRTSATPGLSRDAEDVNVATTANEDDAGGPFSTLRLPLPRDQPAPVIPEGLQAEDDVKLVGKPMLFKPLSVVRSAAKKKNKSKPMKPQNGPSSNQIATSAPNPPQLGQADEEPRQSAALRPKASLFSIHTEEAPDLTHSSGAYEPLFTMPNPSSEPFTDAHDDCAAHHAAYSQAASAPASCMATDSAESIADDLNLSAAARRELFGRDGADRHAPYKVLSINMEQEYRHNDAMRAAGEQQTHNPVRAIQGGKQSLRKLVQNVQNQRDALEESFAKGKSNRKEASGKYGWS